MVVQARSRGQGCVPAAATLDRGELVWRQRSAERIPTVARGVTRQGRARAVATLGQACPHGGVTRQGPGDRNPLRAVLALKRRPRIDVGVSHVEEIEEPLDPTLALACTARPRARPRLRLDS